MFVRLCGDGTDRTSPGAATSTGEAESRAKGWGASKNEPAKRGEPKRRSVALAAGHGAGNVMSAVGEQKLSLRRAREKSSETLATPTTTITLRAGKLPTASRSAGRVAPRVGSVLPQRSCS